MRLPTVRQFALSVSTSLIAAAANAQVIQPSIHTVLETGTEWVSGVGEPASGRFIVYADEHTIRIYNRKTKQTSVVRVQVSEAGGNALSISRSGSRVVFPRAAEPTGDGKRIQTYIWALDLDTLTGAPAGEPHRVSLAPAINASISPDGRWIALATNEKNEYGLTSGQRLVVVPSNGGEEHMLDSAAHVIVPRWTADGKWIYYVRDTGGLFVGNLMRAAVNGTERDSLAVLLPTQAVVDLSADGRYIAIGSRRNGSIQDIRDLKGGLVARFGVNSKEDRLYAFSRTEPNSLLGFRRLEPSTLKTLSLETGALSAFPLNERFAVDPVFSPNGSRLAMGSRAGDQPTLLIYDVGTKQRHVVNTPSHPRTIAWSPDATRISFLGTNAATGNADLFVLELATNRITNLTTVYQSTGYRWRDDGKAIDVLQGKLATGRALPEVHRITMSGARSVVRVLPASDNDNNGPTQLISDSIVIVGMKDRLLAVPLPTGNPRVVYSGSWSSPPNSALSPDKNWVAFEIGAANGHSAQIAIASLDGKTVRKLGLTKGCDVMPSHWLPGNRGMVAWGADSCNNWVEEHFFVPLDGSPAQPVTMPDHSFYTLMPDGKQLLVGVDDPKIGTIMAFDLSKALAAPVQAGKPGKP
jgi:Tol biopolymer transport system component